MSTSEWSRELALLGKAGVDLEAGLSEGELRAAERRVGASFPPDLRSFLATVLPVGDRFPNWRDLETPELAQQLDWPVEGIEFDIEHSAFWLPAWGARPPAVADACRVARARVAEMPRLIPIFAHRYLPAEPCAAGNAVLSVYQTDIVYYGIDLRSYLALEFAPGTDYASLSWDEVRPVRLWSDLVVWNDTVDEPEVDATGK